MRQRTILPSASVTTAATVASTCALLVSEESRLTPMPSLYSAAVTSVGVSVASAGVSVASAGASVASAGASVAAGAAVLPHAVSVNSMHARRRRESAFFIVFDLLS